MPGRSQARQRLSGRHPPLEEAEFRQFLPQLDRHLGDALAALAKIEGRFRLLEIAPALEGAARLPVGPDHDRIEHQMAARDALVVDEGPRLRAGAGGTARCP